MLRLEQNMYNKHQELILDFIKDNPMCKREDKQAVKKYF